MRERADLGLSSHPGDSRWKEVFKMPWLGGWWPGMGLLSMVALSLVGLRRVAISALRCASLGHLALGGISASGGSGG